MTSKPVQVLFICKGNMLRSPVAEAVFNDQAPKGWHATSAGTVPGIAPWEPEGWAIKDIPEMQEALAALTTISPNLSEHRTRRLTPEMVAQADLVISMAEDTNSPAFLLESPKVTHWNIPNTLEGALLIKDRVLALIKTLEPHSH
ncbi:MAG TPA: hypothetical protein VFA15_09715 [Nitrososphaera sp.]|nr:hypothetical protein [Nitrososphaera sp.]